MAEVDGEGLDKQDRRYLETLIGVFDGGPTGVEALAATMNLPTDTLSDEIEPYLLREQFIVRTPRGRVATPRAYLHLGKPMKPESTGESSCCLNEDGANLICYCFSAQALTGSAFSASMPSSLIARCTRSALISPRRAGWSSAAKRDELGVHLEEVAAAPRGSRCGRSRRCPAASSPPAPSG